MKGLGWIRNKQYYVVRGWLQKRGFKKTEDCGFLDKDKKFGWCKFDNGGEYIILYTTIGHSQNGNLKCENVYRYQDVIYD